MIEKIKQYSKNFYVVSSLIFVIWMLFFDGNDIINQIELHKKKMELQEEKAYYERYIKKIEEEYKALESDPELLEKIAREKYLLKNNKEDVYIVE